MGLFVGIDIAIGIGKDSSWTAVVALPEEGDRPVYAERFKPEANNFEKRLGDIGQFCYDSIAEACTKTLQPVKAVLIAEPKMRGIQRDRRNKRTGRIEKVTYNTRPMWDLAQARGAIVSRLEANGIKVYSLVESTMKKAFTGDGRADKAIIHRFAKLQWPNIPDGDYDYSDALMVAETLKRRYKQLRQDRELIH